MPYRMPMGWGKASWGMLFRSEKKDASQNALYIPSNNHVIGPLLTLLAWALLDCFYANSPIASSPIRDTDSMSSSKPAPATFDNLLSRSRRARNIVWISFSLVSRNNWNQNIWHDSYPCVIFLKKWKHDSIISGCWNVRWSVHVVSTSAHEPTHFSGYFWHANL